MTCFIKEVLCYMYSHFFPPIFWMKIDMKTLICSAMLVRMVEFFDFGLVALQIQKDCYNSVKLTSTSKVSFRALGLKDFWQDNAC